MFAEWVMATLKRLNPEIWSWNHSLQMLSVPERITSIYTLFFLLRTSHIQSYGFCSLALFSLHWLWWVYRLDCLIKERNKASYEWSLKHIWTWSLEKRNIQAFLSFCDNTQLQTTWNIQVLLSHLTDTWECRYLQIPFQTGGHRNAAIMRPGSRKAMIFLSETWNLRT